MFGGERRRDKFCIYNIKNKINADQIEKNFEKNFKVPIKEKLQQCRRLRSKLFKFSIIHCECIFDSYLLNKNNYYISIKKAK